MGIVQRKERERLEMRKLIIEAAFEMFVTEGYERTSIRNIAEKIEYSPATIYLYYKDKDQLLYDVQNEAFLLMMTHFEQLNHITNPFEKLTELGKVYMQFAIDNKQYYDLMFILDAPMNACQDSNIWENGCMAYNFLHKIISDCIALKLIKFQDVNLGCLQVWGMVHGLVSLLNKKRFDVMELSQEQEYNAVFASWNEYLSMIKK
jgi:AcrR family transcriptional regulator